MGGGGSSGPTQQQQDLQTEQALTNANLNLEENEQRKVILNAMQGTRAFRGSALTRSTASNSTSGSTVPNAPAAPAPSNQQQNYGAIFANSGSLLDEQAVNANAAAPGTGSTGTLSGGRTGPGGGGGGGGRGSLPK